MHGTFAKRFSSCAVFAAVLCMADQSLTLRNFCLLCEFTIRSLLIHTYVLNVIVAKRAVHDGMYRSI